jgi:alkanesulfonate monooxygenase SsuD/methylene tetrahydromethanopterin reductase-like flavin-dependent oxidoreductase (luciferase family)
MKLGIGLPHMMPDGLTRKKFIEWARLADEAGFHSLGTLDRLNYDSWDVLTVLAGAATVTERIRLSTCVMVLPARNEAAVAKQVAVIDRLSDGRVELGVGVGARQDDFDVLGGSMARRGPRLRQQVARMRAIWAESRRSGLEEGINGPAPVQEPGVPILIGGMAESAVKRALEIGDGYVFGGGTPLEAVGAQLPVLREQAAALGKTSFRFSKIQYCGVGEPDAVLKTAGAQILRYYRNPNLDPAKMVVRGPSEVIAEFAEAAARTGLDELILLPQVPELEQVELIGRDVLPAYR